MGSNENEEFNHNVRETLETQGLPPLIGIFIPGIGDIARDSKENLHIWTGTEWSPPMCKQSYIKDGEIQFLCSELPEIDGYCRNHYEHAHANPYSS